MKELTDYMKTYFHLTDESLEMFDKALEKEKEQIMNAYSDGAKGGVNGSKGQHEFGWVSTQTKQQYYNQTFNKNK